MRNTLINRPENLLDSFFNDSLFNYSLGRNLDIYRSENNTVVEVNLPGYKKEEISISFNNDVLSINAKHEEDQEDDKKDYIYKSRTVQEYSRQIRFDKVDHDKIDANYQDGVLKIVLPDLVKQEMEQKRIEVK